VSEETLHAEEFDAFFESVHGTKPFPWQSRLAREVCTTGRWPSALDLPTGAGKTAAIDIAVFHLAMEAGRGAERRACARILFVVDRRLVVDDAFLRAEKIAVRLKSGATPILRRVASALAHLAESPETPLACVRLRGGTPREPDWARTPSQPIVVVSTVDQVGSRLLFRGYGISESMRPIHAGLLGEDALWLLDEAHLAQPLVETVRGIRQLQSAVEGARPLEITTLSATQDEAAPELLSSEDRAHELLGRRLTASKQAELVLVKGANDFEEIAAQRAMLFSSVGGGPAGVVAVVVNRVASARRIFDLLTARTRREGDDGADVALLIGRSRDLDREANLATLLPRMRAQDKQAGRPLFVVATQTVEAGADLDFDALVTEIAPLDSLRQRFGRLNRMGREIETRAAIVARDSQVAGRAAADPLYGGALRSTWDLLTEKATKAGGKKAPTAIIEFGVAAADAWLPPRGDLERFLAPRQSAPLLLRAFVERWASTSTTPVDDPEVSLFLHGPERGPADVQIVWRADFRPEEGAELAIERIACCPPSSLEALSLPLGEVRRWLRGKAAGDITDLVASAEEDEEVGTDTDRLSLLRWCGEESERTELIHPARIRPGDLIIVPAATGGCDRWGWNPSCREPVTDVAERACAEHRHVEVLRLSVARLVPGSTAADELALQARLDAFRDTPDNEAIAELVEHAGVPAEWRVSYERGDGLRLLRSRASGHEGLPLAIVRRTRARAEPVTEDDRSSFATRRVLLADHSAGVRDHARRLAATAGFDEPRVEDLALAAFLHDAGKAERSFQLWLHGGDELSAASGHVLAKSGRLRLDRTARNRAGLPRGARHEVASLSFALAHPEFARARDPELVLWLIGTHHGWGRPFFPAVEWPPAGTSFATDLGDGRVQSAPALSAAELFGTWIVLRDRVQSRYGHWGLARMEAVLRLADHRRSQLEEEAR